MNAPISATPLIETPPNPGEMLDQALVLDAAAKNYSPPGNRF